jgi:molecular chaperone IbpA
MNAINNQAQWDSLVSAFPSIRRQFVGFDRVIDLLNMNYEPEKIDEVNYEIQMALAGFKNDDLDIKVEDGTLTVEGGQNETDKDANFIHQGIAQRKFRKVWSLADTVVVKGAELSEGILRISLENRIPEDKKPLTIKIKTK